MFSLVFLTFRLEVTGRLFGDLPQNFELRSCPSWHPLSKLPHHNSGKTFCHYIGFNMQESSYTASLQCNQVSNLEPSDTESDTLPLGRHVQKYKFRDAAGFANNDIKNSKATLFEN
ncbi:hypothetical protein AVEN_230011-1 [Araneus ventricosus]|uniref:Uncharacterized protein n=1 Tax=Araneus ventricosus TaxID=182803 RepID=A0A4Y2CSZ1_ARAVE|nr:hypothetical protein AVEN_230011-1 [Araneus ventricosus]